MKSEKLFCLSLETGALVVSGIQLFFCSISLIIASISLSYKDDLVNAIVEKTKTTNDFDPEEQRNLIALWVEVLLSVLLVCAIVNIFSDLCVVYGTIKKRHHFFLPWLIIFGITVGILMLESFVFCCYELFFLFTGNFHLVASMFPTLLMTLAFTVLYSYIWICMKTLYKRFKYAETPSVEWNEKVFK